MTRAAAEIICVLLPLKIESEANGREHWRAKAARAKEHRAAAQWFLLHQPRLDAGQISITLTRIAPRELDGDNLQSGFKAVRDGVADWLGMDDGDKRLTWTYGQRKGRPREYAAEVVIQGAVGA